MKTQNHQSDIIVQQREFLSEKEQDPFYEAKKRHEEDLVFSNSIGNHVFCDSPLLTVCNTELFLEKSIILVHAKNGQGKSLFSTYLVKCFLGVEHQFIVDRECYICYFDTEQSDRVLNNRLIKHKNFVVKQLATRTKKQAHEDLDCYFQQLLSENKYNIIIIDLVAFFVDINNIEQSQEFAERLNRYANEYNCTIVCVSHLNHADTIGKARGHLGTELMQKSAFTLSISKDEKAGHFVVKNEKSRGTANIPDLYFEYDKNVNGLVPVCKEDAKVRSKQEMLLELFNLCGTARYNKTQLVSLMETQLRLSKDTALNYLTSFNNSTLEVDGKRYTYKETKNDQDKRKTDCFFIESVPELELVTENTFTDKTYQL